MVASRGAVASELLVETAYAWRRLAVFARAQHHRRRRPVVRRRRPADGPGRVRRRARQRLPPLHRDDARLRAGRHPDGPRGRPLRRHGAGLSCRRSRSDAATSWRRTSATLGASHRGAGAADRPARQLGDLRPPGRRRLALVHARRGIAVAVVAPAATTSPARSGRRSCRRRSRRSAGGARTSAIGVFCVVTMLPLALALRRRPPVEDVRTAGHARVFAGPRARRPGPAGAPGGGRPRLLHRHVDAPGAHRRLLRRPRLRPRARRRDALADAGHGRRQPARLRPDRRSDRRRPHPAARLDPAMHGALFLPAV